MGTGEWVSIKSTLLNSRTPIISKVFLLNFLKMALCEHDTFFIINTNFITDLLHTETSAATVLFAQG